MATVNKFDVTPASATVMLAVPTEETVLLLTEANSFVPLTKVVGSAVPLHLTTELGVKFVPVTASVKPVAPATTEEGFSDVSAGGGVIVKGSALEELLLPFRTVMRVVPCPVRRFPGIRAVSIVVLTNVV